MWAGSFASNIGTWMQNVVLPAYVYERTGKASMVGLHGRSPSSVRCCSCRIPAGVIADRFDRRRWLIAMQIVQLTSQRPARPARRGRRLAGLAVPRRPRRRRAATRSNAPAWSAMLPTLVRKDDLPGRSR